MGRLIDIDSLKGCAIIKPTRHETIEHIKQCWDDVLDHNDIPIAFDRKKVVAELEKESDFFGGEPMGILQKAYYCKGVEKAIEIVKAGGVDERT